MRFILTIIILINFSTNIYAEVNNFFSNAKKLFDEEKFEESKFLFQRNIVYNPKDANSYLYLAKIFRIQDEKKKGKVTDILVKLGIFLQFLFQQDC